MFKNRLYSYRYILYDIFCCFFSILSNGDYVGYTAEQLGAIKHPGEGHIKIPAVAGSGKSTVLAARIHRLLKEDIKHTSMLVVMFNVSAKKEFVRKLKSIIPADIPEVRTFHSLGNKLIASFVKKGLLSKYRLEKNNWRAIQIGKEAISQCVQPDELSDATTYKSIEDFLSFVDRVKSDIVGPEDIFFIMGINKNKSYFIPAFSLFEEMRHKEKIRFFSDLIYDPVLVLQNDKSARDWVTGHTTHILVDEYQDINAICQYLIKVIAGKTASVTAVGDADQTIYEFRGSQPRYIVSEFDNDFPNSTTFPLTRTFRYGHALSLLADHVIHNNHQREDTLCVSAEGTPNTEIDLFQTGIPNPVLTAINDWRSTGKPLNSIAVLVRLFSMSIPIELELLAHGIPYKVEGNDSVLHIKEINALIALLRLANGSLFSKDRIEDQAENVLDILSVPHIGVRADVLKPACMKIAKNPENAYQIIKGLGKGLQSFQTGAITERAGIWRAIEGMGDKTPIEIIKHYVATTNMYKRFEKMATYYDDAEEKIDAVKGLIAYAKGLGTPLDEFLNHFKELLNQEQLGNSLDTILITSVHRSKGLEWPLVIIPGLIESKFPHIRKKSGKNTIISPAALESERRLFYVAITRAINKVVLVTANDPDLWEWIEARRGGYPPIIDGQENRASRFLYEGNLKLSVEIGRKLHANDSKPCNFKAFDADLANEYLKKHGSSIRVQSSHK